MLELVKPRKTSVASDRPLLVPCGLEGFDYQIDPYTSSVGETSRPLWRHASRIRESSWKRSFSIRIIPIGQESGRSWKRCGAPAQRT